MDNIAFVPVQGTEDKIQNQSISPGQLYFAIDSGKMYLDLSDETRISIGGAGAAIYYTNEKSPSYNQINETYSLSIEVFKNNNVKGVDPKEKDILFNLDNSTFYRIVQIDDISYICKEIAVGGSGTGGGGGSRQAILNIKGTGNINFYAIDGKKFSIDNIVADAGEEVPDQEMTIYWKLSDEGGIGNIIESDKYYAQGEIVVTRGATNSLPLEQYLKQSQASYLYLWAMSLNSTVSAVKQLKITSSKLSLSLHEDFSNLETKKNGEINLALNIIGELNKSLKVYYYINENTMNILNFDGKDQKDLGYNEYGKIEIPELNKINFEHGSHKILVELYQSAYINNQYIINEDTKVDLEFEIVIIENSTNPIVQLGEIKSNYKSYEKIKIPYKFYSFNNEEYILALYKNNVKIGNSIIPKNSNNFSKWEINNENNIVGQKNFYEIRCYKKDDNNTIITSRSFSLYVEKDETIQFEIKKDGLFFEFSPIGRNNSESAYQRKIWAYKNKDGKEFNAEFSGFNWENNGWVKDSSEDSILRISNNAKMSINFPTFDDDYYATNILNNEDLWFTAEMRFKVFNIQKYNKSIETTTRYKYIKTWSDGTTSTFKDNLLYNAFIEEGKDFPSYEAFLTQKSLYHKNDKDSLELKIEITDEEKKDYTQIAFDDLEISSVSKNLNSNNLWCRYGNADGGLGGFGISAQDAYLQSSKNNIVNVDFVEDEIINITFEYIQLADKNTRMLFIYINGVLTGASTVDEGEQFIQKNNMLFTLQALNCDIDLYNIRIYNKSLSITDVIKNYSVDILDIDTFLQTTSLVDNTISYVGTVIDYENMEKYNEERLSDDSGYLMPYVIFDTKDNAKLPYKKDSDITKVDFEFVNIPLERAYRNNVIRQKLLDTNVITKNTPEEEIKKAVIKYYEYHCPSFQCNQVTMSVQGTSSEFYPRRNFKIKTKQPYTMKVGDIDEQTIGKEASRFHLKGGPFSADYDNYIEKKQKIEDALRREISNSHEAPSNETKEEWNENEKYSKKYWYMNNEKVGTQKFTLKVDFMESSGSYNAGFASMVDGAYTKHPLKDYVTALEGLDETALSSYRTSVQGFPVMAFWKFGENKPIFIGYYRLLLDKGSDEVYGFKPLGIIEKDEATGKEKEKSVKQKFLNEKVSKVAECWEFSTNTRGFCSFRKPATSKAEEFSFLQAGYNSAGGPNVMEDFEYRYNNAKDALGNLIKFNQIEYEKQKIVIDDIIERFPDYILEKLKMDDNFKDFTRDNLKELIFVSSDPDNHTVALSWKNFSFNMPVEELMYPYYRNWEKACKWVNSTDVDAVESEYEYTQKEVGEFAFESEEDRKKLYIQKENVEKEIYENLNENIEYNVNQLYYVFEEKRGVNEENFSSEAELFYLNNNKEYERTLIYNADILNYYIKKSAKVVESINNKFEKGKWYYEKEEGLYELEDEFDPLKIYYSRERRTNSDTLVRLPEDGSIRNYGCEYDSKEYRLAKFKAELDKHFDLEYLAVYFIMTEVFECYDSRGKNCMMASWGPQEEGGDYIWYPIFYDIDTQLGVNNTGIPAFDYNIDVTDQRNFSTSDSILWNNFYRDYKDSVIRNKYIELRSSEKNSNLKNNIPILTSIDNIEGWYTFDPEVTNNLSTTGKVPLVATNLDEYFKYILIATDLKAGGTNLDKFKYLNSEGQYVNSPDTSWLYALQGNRAQSRRQFLQNRIEYIDSWLGVKNYERSGDNRIQGRISANDSTTTSDEWIETDKADGSYWLDETLGLKRQPLDAEYWLNLTGARACYLTAGNDNANYSPVKYDGLTPARLTLSLIESGVRKSQNYPEQLLYIYGLNQLLNLGDMSKLYWKEFFMRGSANKLINLQLGSEEQGYSNKSVNSLNIINMPLLKSINISNMAFKSPITLDLEKSLKLEVFRSYNTENISNILFGAGVSLKTLIYSKNFATLELKSPYNLTTLLKDYSLNDEGLYIQGLFDGGEEELTLQTIKISNSGLKYDSYELLKQFFKRTKEITNKKYDITLEGSIWTPYESYNGDWTADLYKDNGHFKLEKLESKPENYMQLVEGKQIFYKKIDEKEVNYNDLKEINNYNSSNTYNINNGEIYITTSPEGTKESDIKALSDAHFKDSKFFVDESIQLEGDLVTIYFKDNDGNFILDSDQNPLIIRTELNNGNIKFNIPRYTPERQHYNFKGWYDAEDTTKNLLTQGEKVEKSVNNNTICYIANFELIEYKIYFKDLSDDIILTQIDVSAGEAIWIPTIYKEHTNPDLAYQFDYFSYSDKGIGRIDNLNEVIAESDLIIYVKFKEISVYENIDLNLFEFSDFNENNSSCKISLNQQIKVFPKRITIPKELNFNEKKYTTLILKSNFLNAALTEDKKSWQVKSLYFPQSTLKIIIEINALNCYIDRQYFSGLSPIAIYGQNNILEFNTVNSRGCAGINLLSTDDTFTIKIGNGGSLIESFTGMTVNIVNLVLYLEKTSEGTSYFNKSFSNFRTENSDTKKTLEVHGVEGNKNYISNLDAFPFRQNNSFFEKVTFYDTNNDGKFLGLTADDIFTQLTLMNSAGTITIAKGE